MLLKDHQRDQKRKGQKQQHLKRLIQHGNLLLG